MENGTITYSNNSLIYNSSSDDSSHWTPFDYNTWWEYCPRCWVSYPVYVKNRLEQAFGVVKKLMEKKIIKQLTLKQFIELVEEISRDLL